jgi:hypothetical protein
MGREVEHIECKVTMILFLHLTLLLLPHFCFSETKLQSDMFLDSGIAQRANLLALQRAEIP